MLYVHVHVFLFCKQRIRAHCFVNRALCKWCIRNIKIVDYNQWHSIIVFIVAQQKKNEYGMAAWNCWPNYCAFFKLNL